MKRAVAIVLAGACCFFAVFSSRSDGDALEPVKIPDWVRGVTRMTFLGPDDIPRAAEGGVQVVHFNMVWPYYPLERDGGGLSKEDGDRLRKFVDACHQRGMKAVLGLPPFPSVSLVKAHPDWRVHPDDVGSVLNLEPREDNLGTRIGCNLGPWGDYLIEILAEIARDYKVDGYSFDGNYHPAICYCPGCKAAYLRERNKPIPPRIDLNDVAYREYLQWRGEKLEQHYAKMQKTLKGLDPNLVVMTWTVNAGRYGHLLMSPRAMPTRLNQLIDLPMQEWWLDETNMGSSVAPAFGAAYIRATTGDRPSASEPYMMSRGNPYGTDSFPKHERMTRAFLALTNGSFPAESLGWPGHPNSAFDVFREVQKLDPWITNTQVLPWAALLVSEQTRQFYAHQDIGERFLPHVYGAYRACMEEHLPCALINDWDLTPANLSKYGVLILPNAAALSEGQIAAVRKYVEAGGGLVATCETSLADELGRPRGDFALADLFGVRYQGRPQAPLTRPALDANFAITVDENYWRQRTGLATVTWTDHSLMSDGKLLDLVPTKSVRFRGPFVAVSSPKETGELAAQFQPDGMPGTFLPAAIDRSFGKGKVVYLPASFDAAYWSYGYPYQRRLLAQSIKRVAKNPLPIHVQAPMCVQATFFEQSTPSGTRRLVHFFNGINTTGGHGTPAMEVPLREESVPIHDISISYPGARPSRAHLEPGNIACDVEEEGGNVRIKIPPLAIHALLVLEP